MVVDAFIHPDLEHVREQVFSHQLQTALMPPVPLSALHVQVDRFHDIGGSGWSAAVKVTESDTRILTGATETSSWGGVTVTWMDSAKEYSPIVAVPFIHPDLVTNRLHVFSHQPHVALMPPVPLSGVQIQLERFQVMLAGVAVAVKVTESGP
jgi:hypothetical protein